MPNIEQFFFKITFVSAGKMRTQILLTQVHEKYFDCVLQGRQFSKTDECYHAVQCICGCHFQTMAEFFPLFP